MTIVIREIDLHAILHTVETRKTTLDCFPLHSVAEHGPDVASEKLLTVAHVRLSISSKFSQRNPQKSLKSVLIPPQPAVKKVYIEGKKKEHNVM